MTTGPDARKLAQVFPVSIELAMEYGLVPDTRPALAPLSRRQRLRGWWRDHVSVYALRARAAHWIDPDPYKDERDDYRV